MVGGVGVRQDSLYFTGKHGQVDLSYGRGRLTLLPQKSDVSQRSGDQFEFLKIVQGEIRPG